jgi:hypothetical protein
MKKTENAKEVQRERLRADMLRTIATTANPDLPALWGLASTVLTNFEDGKRSI